MNRKQYGFIHDQLSELESKLKEAGFQVMEADYDPAVGRGYSAVVGTEAGVIIRTGTYESIAAVVDSAVSIETAYENQMKK